MHFYWSIHRSPPPPSILTRIEERWMDEYYGFYNALNSSLHVFWPLHWGCYYGALSY